MPRDAQDHAVTAASEGAVRAFDHAVEGYLMHRADAAQRIAPVLAADPEFGMAHVLKGYLPMTAYDGTFVPRAREALAEARRHLSRATLREQGHVEALSFWIDGEVSRALSTWEDILAEHPRDVLAFRMHHFVAFWSGRPERMLAGVERVLPRWSASVPGWGAVLASRAFAHEECGNYVVAEASGREALMLDPANLWATHAVAHVMEMQGRRGEGIRFLSGLEQHWEGGNAITHHLWWHRAMYHLERREFGEALGLYDRRFRDLASPLAQAMPDFIVDAQNAASMLFRLELRGVAVGDRWVELAEKAEARVGDHLSPFTLPHRMMALAATARWEAADRVLGAMREAAQANRGDHAAVLRDAAIPVSEAVLAHRRGDYAAAVEAMRPALGVMYRLGGSHAQQDVLEQLFLDAAVRAGLDEDARLLLERAAGQHPVPPERRVGYAEVAARIPH
ncbi:tetratricopeptide repeat protein [Belnapia sp. T6]|uniref:Tetratricopeptide repeat protein 38 n=1 Tax=Belnapia mucosa TaxID=2804532 RepID=A0ABS1UYL5_9PROT|nr:tetratricopeptide repeat protein [Belnapia mucosa]MBL6454546.1 tetratricopeptide repeat protein [Belnapia mucosa]